VTAIYNIHKNTNKFAKSITEGHYEVDAYEVDAYEVTLMSRWAKNPGVYASTYKGWDSTSPNLLQFFYARYLIFCPKRGY